MIPEHGLVSDVVEYVLGKFYIVRKSLSICQLQSNYGT